MNALSNIAGRFVDPNAIQDIEPLGNGLINDTYKIIVDGQPRYVLQRINNAVFTDVEMLQNNIKAVTEHTQYLLEKNPDCKICAVEPLNVSALLGDEPGLHQIQGIGDGFIPDILDTSIITDIIEVSDDDAINTARELARVQGLLVGTSSGANVWAARQMAERYGRDKVIATVLPDRAERYFSTALI